MSTYKVGAIAFALLAIAYIGDGATRGLCTVMVGISLLLAGYDDRGPRRKR